MKNTALLLLVLLALSARSFHAPFLLDDIDELGHVQTLAGATHLLGPDCYGLFRPIKNLLFAAVAHAPMPALPAAHLISTALLLATALLLRRWLRLWYTDDRWCSAGAALWALSPTLVSSHAWFSCANILLSTLALLGALLMWERMQQALDNSDRRGAAAAASWCTLAFAISFFAYEAAIVFPALAALQDRARGRSLLAGRSIKAIGALLLLAAAAYLFRSTFTAGAHPANPGFGPITNAQLLFASAYFAVEHLLWWLVPFGRQEILGTYVQGASALPSQLVMSWLVLVLCIAASLRFFQRAPRAALGALWSILALLPMCNLMPLRTGPFADYYLTLASIGLVLVVLEAARAGIAARRGIAAAILFALAAWRGTAALSAMRWTGTWNEPAALYRTSMTARPLPFRATANLARLLAERGDTNAAERLARLAHDEAPWYVLPYHVLGDLKSRGGQPAAARDWYQAAITNGVADGYTHYALAYVLENGLQDPRGAREHYEILVRPESQHAYREYAYLNLGRLLDLGGDPGAAVDLLQRAARELPRSADIWNNLAVALLHAGRKDEAAGPLREAQRLRGQRPAAGAR